jgi:hypothetical protein
MSQNCDDVWHVGPESPHVNEGGVVVPQPITKTKITDRIIVRTISRKDQIARRP